MIASSIPHDVLIAIFECVASEPWTPPKDEKLKECIDVPINPMNIPWVDEVTIMACSQTCQRWRYAAHATTAFWSTVIIDLDLEEKKLKESIIQIQLRIERARNRPMTVILRNDHPNSVTSGVTDLVLYCMRMATKVFVRFIASAVPELIRAGLRNVPKLERLVIWHLSRREHHLLDQKVVKAEPPLGAVFLKELLVHAPSLRVLHTRNLLGVNPADASQLPKIERLILDDIPILFQRPCLGPAYSNITSLALFLGLGNPEHIPWVPLTFKNLERFEGTSQECSLLGETAWIRAPKLRTLCLHVGDLHWSTPFSDISGAVKELENSSAPSKHCIIHGFASTFISASHARCFRLVKKFQFVDTLEFRGCRLLFTPTWCVAWINGVDKGWEQFLVSANFPYRKDPEEEHDAQLDVEAKCEEILKDSLRSPEHGAPFHNPQNRFMPNLDTLVFNNCTFWSLKEALNFARVLTLRQQVLMSGPRELIFCDMEDAIADVFADTLESAGMSIRFVEDEDSI